MRACVRTYVWQEYINRKDRTSSGRDKVELVGASLSESIVASYTQYFGQSRVISAHVQCRTFNSTKKLDLLESCGLHEHRSRHTLAR